MFILTIYLTYYQHNVHFSPNILEHIPSLQNEQNLKKMRIHWKIYNDMYDYLLHLTDVVRVEPTEFGGVVVGDVPDAIIINS